MKKLFAALPVFILVSALIFSALASSAYFTGNCNVRTGPGLSYGTKGSVNRGSYLNYLGESSVDNRGVTWYKVSFGNGSGWVSSVYCNITSATGNATYGAGASNNSKSYNGNTYYSDDSLYSHNVYASFGDANVRTGPGLGYASLGVLYQGEGAVYMDETSYDDRGVAWYYVRWAGEYGWVSSRYTEIG